jgi:hypothetical protein
MQIGRQVTERWQQGANLLIETSLKLSGSPGRVFHLKYKALIRDPFAAVAGLYRHFEFALNSEALSRMKHFITAHPGGGYGRNTYHFGNYGLDQEEVRHRYQNYMSFFRIESEGATKSISRRPEKQMMETAAVDFQ